MGHRVKLSAALMQPTRQDNLPSVGMLPCNGKPNGLEMKKSFKPHSTYWNSASHKEAVAGDKGPQRTAYRISHKPESPIPSSLGVYALNHAGSLVIRWTLKVLHDPKCPEL